MQPSSYGNLAHTGLTGGVVFFALILAGLLILLAIRKDFLASLLLIFFILYSILIFINYYHEFLPAHEDSVNNFVPPGITMANAWRESFVNNFLPTDFYHFIRYGIPAYMYPLSFVFYLFNNSLIAARLLSTLFGILILFELYQITKTLYDEKTAKFTSFLFALAPYLWNMSTAILRDTMAIFFLVWFFRLWLLHDERPTLKVKILLLFSLLYLGSLRPPVMLVVIFVVILSKTLFNTKKATPLVLRIMVLCFVALALGYVGNKIHSDPELAYVRLAKGLQYADLENMDARIAGSSQAKSGYAEGVRYQSYASALLHSPILVIYFMASPLPWMARSSKQAVALVDSSVLWIMYIFFFLEVKSFIRRNKRWAAIIFTYLILGVISASLVQGNMGAAVRHRMLFTVFIIPFAVHRIITMLRGRETSPAQRVDRPGGAAPPPYGPPARQPDSGPVVAAVHKQVQSPPNNHPKQLKRFKDGQQ